MVVAAVVAGDVRVLARDLRDAHEVRDGRLAGRMVVYAPAAHRLKALDRAQVARAQVVEKGGVVLERVHDGARGATRRPDDADERERERGDHRVDDPLDPAVDAEDSGGRAVVCCVPRDVARDVRADVGNGGDGQRNDESDGEGEPEREALLQRWFRREHILLPSR